MGTTTGTVMTLANSIIGVSVLAMPFCFKLCGIFLSITMLVLSSFVSRLACHFLLKSAAMARRRTFENLAFHTFGPAGKVLVEVCIIGFLLGTCIAFFVVVGDLGPAIIANLLSVANSPGLRTTVLVGLAAFVVLPLGLLRSIDSLTTVSTATIGFYVCLVLKVVAEAAPRLVAADWLDHVSLWNPSGLLQCLPIFTMALFCQTQVFEVFAAWPSASLDRMNSVVKQAVNMCTVVYIAVGFFGYVANAERPFTGNVLMSFEPSAATELIKLGFVLSVAVSFPLVIFPCRASLNSLIYQRGGTPPSGSSRAAPAVAGAARRVRLLTASIVAVSLCVAWAVPSIELVLGLVGSTIGVAICLGFPALAMLRTLPPAATPERPRAHAVLLIGAIILVAGTYANLSALATSPSPLDPMVTSPVSVNSVIPETVNNNNNNNNMFKIEKDKPQPIASIDDTRREPPIPIEPVNKQESQEFKNDNIQPEAGAVVDDIRREPPVPIEPGLKAGVNKPQVEKPAAEPDHVILSDEIAGGSMHKDALAKEDAELLEAEKQQKSEAERNKLELLAKLEKHKQEQTQLLEEQKRILEEMNKHSKAKEITQKNDISDKKKTEIKENKINNLQKGGESHISSLINNNTTLIKSKDETNKNNNNKTENNVEITKKKDNLIKEESKLINEIQKEKKNLIKLENTKQYLNEKNKLNEIKEAKPLILEKILTPNFKIKSFNAKQNIDGKEIEKKTKILLNDNNIEKEVHENKIEKIQEKSQKNMDEKEPRGGIPNWDRAVPLPIAILNGSRPGGVNRSKRDVEDCEPRILAAQQLSSPERVEQSQPDSPPVTDLNLLIGFKKKTKK